MQKMVEYVEDRSVLYRNVHDNISILFNLIKKMNIMMMAIFQLVDVQQEEAWLKVKVTLLPPSRWRSQFQKGERFQ